MIEQIREFYWAKPFLPFTLHLANGRAVNVSHPEFMALGPDGRTVAVYESDGVCRHVNVSLVTNVSVRPASAASAN